MSRRNILASILGIFAIGCTTADTTAPEFEAISAQSSLTGNVAASASGGANWVLEVFGFTIPQTLGFSARRFEDGSVRGHINYQQTFQGQTFHFNATVTCMEIYDGNRVKYGGKVIVSNDPDVAPDTYIWFQSIDNGEGAGALPDQSTGSGFGTAQQTQAFCDNPAAPNPLFLSAVSGNIQVSE